MSLQSKIKADMVTAMKAKETVELSFLRVISGELSTNAKKKEKERLDEQKILRTMRNNAKEMNTLESNFEIEILDRYIVKIEMLTEEQMRLAIASTIETMGYSGMQCMGAVMKEIKNFGTAPQFDMKIASGIVKELLSQ